MKTLLGLGVVASTIWVVTSAFADDKAVCVDAASNGQTSRDEHKLVEARDQFRLCARAVCPAAVRNDCANWLDSVERNLPTVVVTAKNSAGAPLLDFKVSVDGQPLSAKFEGEAIPMNPGPHAFHFEAADGTKLDQQVVVSEGQQNQPIAVTLGSPLATERAPDQAVARKPSDGPRSSPWRTVGWVAGGIGIVGLGLGTTFGIIAIGDKSRAHCDAAKFCDADPLDAAKSASIVSDVGLIAGGLLFATGAALVLFVPHGNPEAGASVKLAPMVADATVVEFANNQVRPQGIAVDGSFVYWLDAGSGTDGLLQKASLTTKAVSQLAGGIANAGALGLDGSVLYFTTGGNGVVPGGLYRIVL